MDKDILRVVGAVLWWAEGSKSIRDKRWKNAVSYPIEITNTNTDIIKIFLRYIVEVVGIPKDRLKVQLQIHENDDKIELEQYWSQVTGIGKDMFNKTIIRPIGNKPGKSKGTCKIRCYDKEFYGKIYQDLQNVISSL
ncbi:hypothetical protein EB118_04630 [bacterium]|nr:hypothetical protein [bacterium]NBX97680.1 hypothetical protein [bacterium]NDC94153.1 hypothetical protein [bacterium]NDD83150.1 hypothetical protein [bacterium]NDG29373.1 hypothetical protein [bacterium]